MTSTLTGLTRVYLRTPGVTQKVSRSPTWAASTTRLLLVDVSAHVAQIEGGYRVETPRAARVFFAFVFSEKSVCVHRVLPFVALSGP